MNKRSGWLRRALLLTALTLSSFLIMITFAVIINFAEEIKVTAIMPKAGVRGDIGAVGTIYKNSVVSDNNFVVQGNVGIGNTSPVAALDVNSTTSGILPPRMTTSQKNNISTEGSIAYDNTLHSLNFRDESRWLRMGEVIKYKVNDESRGRSDIAADTELRFSAKSGEIWAVKLVLSIDNSPGYFQWSFGAGGGSISLMNLHNMLHLETADYSEAHTKAIRFDAVEDTATISGLAWGLGWVSDYVLLIVEGIFQCGSDSTFTFQWGTWGTSGAGSTIRKGSYLIAYRLQ